jgi:hypothetical protein
MLDLARGVVGFVHLLFHCTHAELFLQCLPLESRECCLGLLSVGLWLVSARAPFGIEISRTAISVLRTKGRVL